MASWPVLYQVDRISIRGGVGVGLLMALLVAWVLERLPVLRGPVVAGIAIGVILGGGWIVSRRRRPLDARTPPLSLGLSEAPRRPR
jgi:MFS family permease